MEEWKKEMDEQNWKYEEIPWCPEGFFIDRPKSDRTPLGKTLPHAMGRIYSQEASSMMPAEILWASLKNGEKTLKILDVASAPGSKSTQLGAKMKGQGLLVTNELSSSRMKGLFSNLERCGIANSILTHYDGVELCNNLPEVFDGILLDAPCTGEGTVRKDYDALKNWKPENAVQMASLQKRLIFSAFEALKPGGTLVYSTCTLAEEENEGVIRFLKESFPNAEISPLNNTFLGAEKACTKEGFLRIWPHIFDTEGFFVARITKQISPLRVDPKGRLKKIPKNFPFTPVLRREMSGIEAYFQNQWGIPGAEIWENGTLWRRDKEIWLFPKGAEEIFVPLRCDRIGIPLCTIHEKEIRLRHEAAIAFGALFTSGMLEISEVDAEKVYGGKDLEWETEKFLEKREYLCFSAGTPVALGKYDGEKWKNGIPRGNVRKG